MLHRILTCKSVKVGNNFISYEVYGKDEQYSFYVTFSDECVSVIDFTTNKEFAFYVFNLVADGAARPCHLKCIIEDLICEYDPNLDYGELYERFKHTQRA